jgi:ParB family chromosome partitioning protein
MFKIIEMAKIKSGKNIRNERDADIQELADSIEANGLINPIMVKAIGGGLYEVVAGHRRYEAVKRLGLPHIECNITDETSERDLMLAQIAENVQRKDMSALELVACFDDLKKRFNVNQKQLARYFHKSDVWVTNQYQAVKLLNQQYGKDIPEDVRKMGAGQIKYAAKKKMGADIEHVLCKGMSVKVKGHCYTITCVNNATENALREFINKRKL